MPPSMKAAIVGALFAAGAFAASPNNDKNNDNDNAAVQTTATLVDTPFAVLTPTDFKATASVTWTASQAESTGASTTTAVSVETSSAIPEHGDVDGLEDDNNINLGISFDYFEIGSPSDVKSVGLSYSDDDPEPADKPADPPAAAPEKPPKKYTTSGLKALKDWAKSIFDWATGRINNKARKEYEEKMKQKAEADAKAKAKADADARKKEIEENSEEIGETIMVDDPKDKDISSDGHEDEEGEPVRRARFFRA